MFTEEMPWLKGRDLERVMGGAVVDWLGWKRPAAPDRAPEMAGAPIERYHPSRSRPGTASKCSSRLRMDSRC